MAGKGSKRRKENYKQYITNYDDIKWTPKLTDEQKQELMNEVRKATKLQQSNAEVRRGRDVS